MPVCVPRTRSFNPGCVRSRWLGAALPAVAIALLVEPAAAVEVAPEALQASIVSVSAEGPLCPPETMLVSRTPDAAAATINFAGPGVSETGKCRIVVDLDVPSGLAIGMPRTAPTVTTNEGGGTFSRVYSYEGRSGSVQFSDSVAPEEIVEFVDLSTQLSSPTCQASRRARFVIEITATPGTGGHAILDWVDLDTAYRFGADWESCDPADPLEVTPGAAGEFCDGPNGRPCADGLVCSHEQVPQAPEGVCAAP